MIRTSITIRHSTKIYAQLIRRSERSRGQFISSLVQQLTQNKHSLPPLTPKLGVTYQPDDHYTIINIQLSPEAYAMLIQLRLTFQWSVSKIIAYAFDKLYKQSITNFSGKFCIVMQRMSREYRLSNLRRDIIFPFFPKLRI